jgi:hypothetical protein
MTVATATAAAALAFGVTACGSAANGAAKSGVAAATATRAATLSATPAAFVGSPATPTAGATPAGSPCPDRSGTQTILADGATTVDGAFAITGYVQTAQCGPGVPDDVQYTDTGARRSFVLPADVRVELLGTALTGNQHPATLSALEVLLRAEFSTPPVTATSDGSMLWSDYFQLNFGADGRISEITDLYRP